jgi:hypothetical protein
MSSFELKIDTSNAAFEDDYICEVERIFARVIAQLIEADYLNGKHSNIRDTNGNVVGTFKVTD